MTLFRQAAPQSPCSHIAMISTTNLGGDAKDILIPKVAVRQCFGSIPILSFIDVRLLAWPNDDD